MINRSKLRRWWKTARPKWWGRASPPRPPVKPDRPERGGIKVSPIAHAKARKAKYQGYEPTTKEFEPRATFAPAVAAPGVRPSDNPKLAMDDAGNFGPIMAWAGQFSWGERLGFMGYPYLAELTQRPEYRKLSEIIAEEMTRKWIKLEATGDEDKSKKIKRLTQLFKEFGIRDTFRRATELEGFFGLSHLYIDVGTTDDRDELIKPLLIDKAKIGKGDLKAITAVEPTWTSPSNYNTNDPLKPDYYRPTEWYVMGKRVHASRMITLISRPVPDILKPAYNFGGMSLSQLAKPYIDNWLRTRQSVSDLLHSFTVFILKSNLMSMLGGGDGDDEFERLDLFNECRDNRNLMMIDNETEELENISVPLGTLDALQAQSQEQQASVSSIPLVKLLGVTPAGLNASSDGEIRVFYDHIFARQENLYAKPLELILQVMQLHEYGEIDPEITVAFIPLWQLDEAGLAGVRKTNAETDAILVNEVGAIAPEDSRKRLAGEPESPYHGLDLSSPAPGPPQLDGEGGGKGPGVNAGAVGVRAGEEGSNSGANSGV